MTDIKWVPEWVKSYSIMQTEDDASAEILFYVNPNRGQYPIEDLRELLSRRDVGQQIRDKPWRIELLQLVL
jgi:hypothetical protein